jgi:methylated-DNA-protein-cysteine methyltransferase related protein
MPSRRVAKNVDSAFARVWKVVRKIPRGKVMTYGAVARVAGLGRGARVVGYAMRAAPPGGVPWQRVLGLASAGWARVTIRDPLAGAVQRQLLEQEGVVFDGKGRVDLGRYGRK